MPAYRLSHRSMGLSLGLAVVGLDPGEGGGFGPAHKPWIFFFWIGFIV